MPIDELAAAMGRIDFRYIIANCDRDNYGNILNIQLDFIFLSCGGSATKG